MKHDWRVEVFVYAMLALVFKWLGWRGALVWLTGVIGGGFGTIINLLKNDVIDKRKL